MIKAFLADYWELVIMGLLLLNTIIQKLEKIKGNSDILTWIWQFLTWIKSVAGQLISIIFSTKPGKLPMLFIGLFITSLFFTGLAYAGSNVTLQWEGNLAYENVTHYNVYRSTDQETWVLANVDPILDIGENVTHEWTDVDLLDNTYYWYATAVNNYGRSSDPSIILSETFGQPSPPRGFIIKIVDWVMSWLKGIFGGSFRLA